MLLSGTAIVAGFAAPAFCVGRRSGRQWRAQHHPWRSHHLSSSTGASSVLCVHLPREKDHMRAGGNRGGAINRSGIPRAQGRSENW